MNSIKKFRSRKLRNIIFLLLSMGFVFIGINFSAYLVICLFSLCALVFSIELLPNSSYLKLNEDGFEYRYFFRTASVFWSEVNEFLVVSVSHEKVVGWKYLDISKVNPKKIRILISGMDCALPEKYGISPESLAKIMNEHKLKNA